MKNYSAIEQFLIIILVEHIIIAFKLLIAAIIKDVPQWVSNKEQEQTLRLPQLFKNLDDKRDEFIANGGILLQDKIQHAKAKANLEISK